MDINGLLGDPMLQVGLGLLSESNPGFGETTNLARGALGGLQRAQQSQFMVDEQRRLEEEAARREAEYQAFLETQRRLQELYGAGAMTGAAAPQYGPTVAAANQMAGRTPTPTVQEMLAQITGQPGASPFFTEAGGAPAGARNVDPADVDRIMLMYGNREQQMAAMANMGARERFNTQYAKVAGGRGTLRSRIVTDDGRIAMFYDDGIEIAKDPDSGEPLKASESYRLVESGAGGQEIVGTRSGVRRTLESDDEAIAGAAEREAALSQARAEGAAAATYIAQAESGAVSEQMFLDLLNDPAFENAVGRWNNLGAALARMAGIDTDQARLNAAAQRFANQGVVRIADSWKGAISEAELALFVQTVPQPDDPISVWRDWYRREFVPMQRLVEAQAAQGYQAPGADNAPRETLTPAAPAPTIQPRAQDVMRELLDEAQESALGPNG